MKLGSVFGRTVRFCIAILVGVLLLPLTPEQPRAGVEAWTRTLDPVIITGNQLSLFSGVALADLFVYTYDGSTWNMVPFQFDEVNSEGSFVQWENGVLDGNDQLVFMAADLGVTAATHEWPDDADSKNHSRYEVHVTNPLHPAEEGWVYVYRSATLAPTFAPYVTWDGASNSILASTYIIGYAPSQHIGMDSLQLNGYPGDVLDRSKFRLRVLCIDSDGGENRTLITENSEEVTDEWTPPDIHGPVRVGGGTLDEYSWSYASMFMDESTFTVTDPDPEDCVEFNYEFFRASEDWQNPLVSGMAPMGYFDSNTPAGVMVDGVYDPIPSSPLATWRQVSGAKGSVVEVRDIDGGGAVVINYYLDLIDEDPDDTGDLRSFADAGFYVVEPDNPVLISTAHYVLDPFQVNVGETYRQYYTNPLQATATAQDYVDPAPNAARIIYLPKPIYDDVETTFTAGVDGFAPFTYDWEFGDDGGVASGNTVDHTFTMTGTIPVTLTVTNDYGTNAFVWTLMVWDPGTDVRWSYMPLILRNGP